ncbi:MAG: PD-(D/E)XK nuclease family protein [Myxococcota bacterium]|mgnify:CR=1 FL=1|nr:PD-(D/E)XK nuclease family protein [Myxococcota bacterium]MDP6243358.1 PD-(D/E)XK nuclease family protein [Myxococcota bacterium]MDP7073289.1 PD-(D/E)XK nuclease family protein [Myxococcota bacterium]MDP7298431.1 PD-(D/E)XK nuclease family protein [Myxococcota bacterium]MDP7433069.1 PD-(D/E)XK nuclease family protein [Myxococcota bacterium]
MNDRSPGEGPVLLAAGPRAAEEALLGHLAALERAGVSDPACLAEPVRVVVPSASLREHVAVRLVARVGRPVLGFEIQTLHGLALELLDRAGETPLRADVLFPVLVRRAARGQPELRSALDALEDGYGAVVAAVADLSDAGFDASLPVHVEALDEALAEAGLPAAAHARARAVAAAAATTVGTLNELGIGRPGVRLARAAALLEEQPARLPSRAVWIHGFADATGTASDLLAALVRHRGARAIIDLPPDPARPTRRDLGAAFAGRLVARLGASPTGPLHEEGRGRPVLRTLRAAGTDAEVRGVADRIHELLEAGVVPEEIGVVARQLGSYAVAVRTHFARLGIPFSSRGQLGPADARARRIHALLDLLSSRESTPSDRWLDAVLRFSPGARADLRLGLHTIGAARLAQVAAIDPALHLSGDFDSFPLPARIGISAAREGAQGDVKPRVRRCQLKGRLLRAGVARAVRASDRLAAWPAQAPLRRHLEQLRDLAQRDLGWLHGFEFDTLEAALAGLEAQLPDLELSSDEFSLLVRTALRDAGGAPLGGAGAGVRVLSVVEARAHTFEQLFVLGVNRDAFPRPVLEDPLLPDAVRRPLEVLLPEIPVKGRGHEEEHYLFAQLAAAAPQVTLAWQVADDEGNARAASPFVERLRGGDFDVPCDDVPGLQAPPERSAGRPRTAWEAAIAEGLFGARVRFAELLALAAEERSSPETSGVDPAVLAAGRMAVVEELEDRPGLEVLGPYFGFVGPQRLAADLRANPVYVTHVERMARCPWQLFVRRFLGIEPPPTALGMVPDLGALVVGDVVHAVLQAIVEQVLPRETRTLEASAEAVPWPEPEVFEALLHRVAADRVQREGLGPPSFARVLVEKARPLVLAARQHGWPGPGAETSCVGAELEGAVDVSTLGAAPRRVHFKADRVDRSGAGLWLVDYKTGKAKTQKSLLKNVARGEALQAAAYAFGTGGEGRYLYLAGDAGGGSAVSAEACDAELRAAFEVSVGTVLAALGTGSFFPRLMEPGKDVSSGRCEYCEVREACLQGDGGARARLGRWSEAGVARHAAEAAALALWRLPGASG